MKRTFVLIMIVFLLAGCSSANQTSSSSGNSTSAAEDLKDVANDLKETGQEVKDTLSDTFNEAFGDLLGNSQKEEVYTSEDVVETEPTQEKQQEQTEELRAFTAGLEGKEPETSHLIIAF